MTNGGDPGFEARRFDPAPLAAWLRAPDPDVLARNRTVAETHLSLAAQTEALRRLLDAAGWLP
mgnify:CR=1 FL=1